MWSTSNKVILFSTKTKCRCIPYHLSTLAQKTLDCAEKAFEIDSRFSQCLEDKYIEANSFEVDVASAKECAVKCAIGCGKACDAYKVDGNKCKFISYTDTIFPISLGPKPTCIPQGQLIQTKLVKKAGM